MACPVYMAQYAHNGPDKSHHWSLFVEKNVETTTGAVFDLKESNGVRRYHSAGNADLRRSKVYVGKVLIGQVTWSDRMMSDWEKRLKPPGLEEQQSCQTWCLQAIEVLKNKDLLSPSDGGWLSEETIRSILETQKPGSAV